MTARTVCRTAFTLIELLVVVAIIGVLIGLLLPAVQKVREAANRIRCQNNLKQLGLALHGHHDGQGQFPMGCKNQSFPWGPPRGPTWVYGLLPYMEQDAVYRKFDPNLPPGVGNAVFAGNANSLGAGAPTSIPIPLFICPSDGIGRRTATESYGTFIQGNYLAYFGNLDYGSAIPGASAAHKKAAFGFNYGARFADMLDGSSNTMAIGEYLRGLEGSTPDFRGSIWSDQPGYSQLYTRNTPNSSSPDYFIPGYCNHRPELNLPCTNSNYGGTDTASSRSRHPGGVSALFADGSVHFISDNVALNTWQALGSIAGSEIVGDY